MRGITIGSYNTLTNFGFILQSDLKVETPKVKTSFVKAPAAHGQLDFSRALTGAPIYDTRKISFTLSYKGSDVYETQLATLVAAVHGLRLNVWHPSISGWHYTGLVNVSNVGGYGVNSVKVEIDADPWLYRDNTTTQTVTLTANQTKTVTLTNGGRTVYPTFKLTSQSGDAKVSNHAIHTYGEEFDDVYIASPSGTVTLQSTDGGTVLISYEEFKL